MWFLLISVLVLSVLILILASRGRGRAQSPDPAGGEVITNTIGMKLKLIPAGSFMMGSPDTEKDRENYEGPVHKVTISKPFYLGVYEVTQEQWKKVMGNNPSRSQGANRPVEEVSWDDTQEFIRKLSAMEKVTYRLPTEAEWEYACRAGTTTAYYWGGSFDAGYAWSGQNSGGATHDVGTRKPNAWDLFDMSGNVWEWCGDWYSEKNYGMNEQADPMGASNGDYRVLRGGSWSSHADGCRSARRGGNTPGTRHYDIGFRLARTI